MGQQRRNWDVLLGLGPFILGPRPLPPPSLLPTHPAARLLHSSASSPPAVAPNPPAPRRRRAANPIIHTDSHWLVDFFCSAPCIKEPNA
jgi:hypothetical protein